MKIFTFESKCLLRFLTFKATIVIMTTIQTGSRISQLGGKNEKIYFFNCDRFVSSLLAACGPTSSGPSGTLIVGTPKMNGDFVAGFGNSAYDNSIRTMIWDYPTYTTTPGGEFVLNETVVEKLVTSVDDAGNKTYTFTIKKGIKWSDGSAATAKDFVFDILFSANPAWTAAGATSSTGDSLVGYNDYKTGVADKFAGVKLIDDNNSLLQSLLKTSLTSMKFPMPHLVRLRWLLGHRI
ncbi:MAG: ABC transporter substrate-binding protein [Candidatus Moduliflexus flocculans]|nr:ABC transporter substrate-binding protein [Candidatus Moduliflexus flocculans]